MRRKPRFGAKGPETFAGKVSARARRIGGTFLRPSPRHPRPLSEARGERVAPEDCRAGHLRASSPSRSAVRHGFLGSRLRRPATDLARPPPGRYPPFPARAGRMKPGHRVVSCGVSVLAGRGASACNDGAPDGPEAAHAGGATPAPACVRGFAARPGLAIHRHLPAPPLAVRDYDASGPALGGLPGDFALNTVPIPGHLYRTPLERQPSFHHRNLDNSKLITES